MPQYELLLLVSKVECCDSDCYIVNNAKRNFNDDSRHEWHR
jgi:hypothetical protein